jgi:hypothetical protein
MLESLSPLMYAVLPALLSLLIGYWLHAPRQRKEAGGYSSFRYTAGDHYGGCWFRDILVAE